MAFKGGGGGGERAREREISSVSTECKHRDASDVRYIKMGFARGGGGGGGGD